MLAFAFKSRDKAFYLLLVHTIVTFINKNLKIIYRNPRPYMVHSEIIAFGCPKSFGNPSGHSSLSACFLTTLFLVIFHDKDYLEEAKRNRVESGSNMLEPLLNGSFED